jgi:hypothetical protein
MQYLLLIYANEARWAEMSEAELNSVLSEYMQFTQEITQSGNYKGGNELKPISTATTVRVREKKRLVTDGPFAETKEQLGGYYLVEAKDLDEAIAPAARIPSARAAHQSARDAVAGILKRNYRSRGSTGRGHALCSSSASIAKSRGAFRPPEVQNSMRSGLRHFLAGFFRTAAFVPALVHR